MKHIIKNLKSFYKTEKNIFLLTLSCTLISSIMLFFSYGLFCVYHEKKLLDINELLNLEIEIMDEGGSVSKKELEQCLTQFSPKLADAIDMIYVEGWISETTALEFRFTWKDGDYEISRMYADNMIKNNFSSIYFSPEEERQGSLVALVPEGWPKNEQNEITLQGKNYKIIGCLKKEKLPIIPYASIDSDTLLNPKGGIYLSFKKAISKRQYKELCDIFTSQLKDKISIPPLAQIDTQNTSFYNTMLLIAVLIICISASNFTIQFQYILTRRKKMLMIYRLCGLNRQACIRLFMGEALSIVILVSLTGMFLFHFGILPFFTLLSDDWIDIYHINIYLAMFFTNIAVTAILLFAMIRKVMAAQVSV